MILKLPNLATLPKELREFVYSLRDWAKERERFEKSITSGANTRSASGKLALRQGIIVDRTRVDSALPDAVTGTSIDTTGSLIPTKDNKFDIGMASKRWRDLYIGRDARIDGALGVTGNLTVAGTATLAGLSVSGLSITGNLSVAGKITGASDLSLVGGISSTGVVTSGGQLQARAGLTCTGGVTIGGMVFVSSAAANGFTGSLVPIGNLLGNVGLTARRWAQIFGGTITTTNSVVIGGTLTVNGSGQNACDGNLRVGNLTIIGSISPTVDGTLLGSGNPTLVPDLRWNGMFLSGILTTAKGADVPSGTTLSFAADGNYFDVTGTSTIGGISYQNTAADPQAGIFNFVHLDSNPTFTHHATRLQLSGSTDFVGRTNDHLLMVSDGGGNWREAFRSYRPLAYGSCTSAFTEIAWTQAAAAQNTWYRITDTDMADGILSLVAHDGSGRLTVTNDGVYKIAYTASVQSDAANHILQTSIFISGSGNSSGGGMAQAVTASVYYQLTGTAIIRLAAGATIDVDIRTLTAGAPTLTVGFLDLTAVQVGW